MKKLTVSDVTLEFAARDKNTTLSFKEKIEIARHLQNVGVDVICLPAVDDARVDALFVRTAAPFTKNTVLSIPVGMSDGSAEAAWGVVKAAAHPRLRVELPVSPVQMEYVCHKKEPKMLELITTLVSLCASLCEDVEFRALDATRAEREFLIKAISCATDAGATTVTLCDSEGATAPDDFGAFIGELRSVTSAHLGVLCENSFGLALASSILAAKAGADGLTVSFAGLFAPNAAELSRLFAVRAADLGLSCSLKTTELGRAAKQIEWVIGTKRSERSPFDSGVSERSAAEGPALQSGDGIAEIKKAVEGLGYDLSDEDIKNVYEEFKRVAAKKNVGPRELDAIVAYAAMQVPATYKLVSYVINSGNVITPSAHIKLEKNGKPMQSVCLGDGPIDASFLAIEQIVGHHYELDDFQIQAVTEGREAMGSTVVKLRSRGKLYSGNGISTDILGSSIGAYLNALNKITYEES